MSMRVFPITLKDSECCHEISLLEEVRHIWQLVLLLLHVIINTQVLPVSERSVGGGAFASA